LDVNVRMVVTRIDHRVQRLYGIRGSRMLSQTVDYALRAATYLATSPKQSRTVDQIASATHVPGPYLSKVLQQLVRKKIVESRRGAGGGFTLARPPHKLRILEIVQAVDPIQRITTCPLGLAAHGKRLCPLHRRLDNALAEMERAFSASTLAEVLAEPTRSTPLCSFPGTAARSRQAGAS
jgi:Rrf2 family protein